MIRRYRWSLPAVVLAAVAIAVALRRVPAPAVGVEEPGDPAGAPARAAIVKARVEAREHLPERKVVLPPNPPPHGLPPYVRLPPGEVADGLPVPRGTE